MTPLTHVIQELQGTATQARFRKVRRYRLPLGPHKDIVILKEIRCGIVIGIIPCAFDARMRGESQTAFTF